MMIMEQKTKRRRRNKVKYKEEWTAESKEAESEFGKREKKMVCIHARKQQDNIVLFLRLEGVCR